MNVPSESRGKKLRIHTPLRVRMCRRGRRKEKVVCLHAWFNRPDILVLNHESRKIRYFWVVQKFKVLVFHSGRFGLLPAAAWQDWLENERATGCAIFFHPCNIWTFYSHALEEGWLSRNWSIECVSASNFSRNVTPFSSLLSLLNGPQGRGCNEIGPRSFVPCLTTP